MRLNLDTVMHKLAEAQKAVQTGTQAAAKASPQGSKASAKAAQQEHALAGDFIWQETTKSAKWEVEKTSHF